MNCNILNICLSIIIFSLLSCAFTAEAQITAKSIQPHTPTLKVPVHIQFEVVKREYDTLIPIFDGLFITHRAVDNDYYLETLKDIHNDSLGIFWGAPKNASHKWGVIDSTGVVVVPFVCDGVKSISAHEGIATIYTFSMPLNTGIPRYTYHGDYTRFTKDGMSNQRMKKFQRTVTAIADYHREEFVIEQGPYFFIPPEYMNQP